MVIDEAGPGRPPGPSGSRYSAARCESVNHAARFVTTTSLTKVWTARREVVRRYGRARPRVVDERVAGRTAGYEQPAAIDLHADRRGTCRRGDELRALAGPKASSIHLSCRDRAHVELPARDRDSLGLETVRKLDAVREGLRAGDRGHDRCDPGEHEYESSHSEIPLLFRRTSSGVPTPEPRAADCQQSPADGVRLLARHELRRILRDRRASPKPGAAQRTPPPPMRSACRGMLVGCLRTVDERQRKLDRLVEGHRASFRLGCDQCGVVLVEEVGDPRAQFPLQRVRGAVPDLLAKRVGRAKQSRSVERSPTSGRDLGQS